MFKTITLVLFVLPLVVLVPLSLGAAPVVAHAYEQTEFDRQSAFSAPFPSSFGTEAERQRQADFDRQTQQRNQSQRDQWNREPGYDPRAFDAPAPFNLQQQNGRLQVCQRGFNSVTCQ